MCGIAGIIASHTIANLQQSLEAMVQALTHRGPDGQGNVTRQLGAWNVGLAHTRLAVLDLSEAGHQPMVGSRKSCWLTYNGEVYNFGELHRELGSQHYKCRSRTDSEVILRAYETWGVDTIPRFRGMFSFGLWDETLRRLLLARDPFGIKPLYYYQTKDVFLFASEIRALLASGLVPRRLSLEGLTSYLHFGSVQAPWTIIQGVHSLLPGRYLIVEPRKGILRVEEVPYAEGSLLETSVPPVADRQEAIRLLREILEESVRLHLVSDVPLGVFLSGGIDSSAIAALMSQMADEKPNTFSVVFAEEEFSEVSYARLVAKELDTAHHEIPLSEAQLLNILPEALGSMDQPTIDGINTFVISKVVKEAGITVALSGLGGDELFAGYPSFRRARRLQTIARLPHRLRRTACSVGRTVFNGSVQQNKFWNLVECDGSPRAAYTISRQLFAPDEIQTILRGMAPQVVAAPHVDVDGGDQVNAVSLCELQGYMANTLLRDTDCMSMAHALEVRVPFIDPVVVRYVLGLPGEWKVDRHRHKPLLLDAMKGLLPGEMLRRPKMGFTLPFDLWIRSGLKSMLDEVLSHGKGLTQLGVSAEFVRVVWHTFKKSPRKERWSRPWALYVLTKWCEINEVQS